MFYNQHLNDSSNSNLLKQNSASPKKANTNMTKMELSTYSEPKDIFKLRENRSFNEMESNIIKLNLPDESQDYYMKGNTQVLSDFN